jgi:LmbE family N-acetylglucosaminyl deacetylase
MRLLEVLRRAERCSVLCIGAHADDIEIGAGGTILHCINSGAILDVHWCVLSAADQRGDEARASATAFLRGAASATFEVGSFRDSFFPYQGAEIKQWFAELKSRVNPDIILTHHREDAHQDHREVSLLTWNTFRNHLIFEYEIPKWDGDLGHPNGYIPLRADIMERKIQLLMTHFGTQRSKDWFDAETFRGLGRLRGIECRAPEGYAEAFTLRKFLLS